MREIEDGEPLLLDISQVKVLLSIGTNNVYKFIRENNIAYLKIGSKIKVYRKSLTQWIENNLQNYST